MEHKIDTRIDIRASDPFPGFDIRPPTCLAANKIVGHARQPAERFQMRIGVGAGQTGADLRFFLVRWVGPFQPAPDRRNCQ